jgi:hypothetical protein
MSTYIEWPKGFRVEEHFERNTERFAGSDSNGERNAEHFRRNDFKGGRNAEWFGLTYKYSKGELNALNGTIL